MEQVKAEQILYSAAIYCRLSKDDEQAGKSVSIETQKMMLKNFCHEQGFPIYEIYADDGYSELNYDSFRLCSSSDVQSVEKLGRYEAETERFE